MEDQGTKDGAVTGSKADQKKDSTEGPLSETEVCSDFGFIEPALKCRTRLAHQVLRELCKTMLALEVAPLLQQRLPHQAPA